MSARHNIELRFNRKYTTVKGTVNGREFSWVLSAYMKGRARTKLSYMWCSVSEGSVDFNEDRAVLRRVRKALDHKCRTTMTMDYQVMDGLRNAASAKSLTY